MLSYPVTCQNNLHKVGVGLSPPFQKLGGSVQPLLPPCSYTLYDNRAGLPGVLAASHMHDSMMSSQPTDC